VWLIAAAAAAAAAVAAGRTFLQACCRYGAHCKGHTVKQPLDEGPGFMPGRVHCRCVSTISVAHDSVFNECRACKPLFHCSQLLVRGHRLSASSATSGAQCDCTIKQMLATSGWMGVLCPSGHDNRGPHVAGCCRRCRLPGLATTNAIAPNP
jgi:hypothetical protein